MKIAFVIQRCGPEIYAGAERLVYQLAENLSDLFDIDVLTTTALDASTWENYFPEGLEKKDNFSIRRFKVDKPRDPVYVKLSQYLESNNNDEEKGLEFIEANGPVSSGFLDYLKKSKDKYDLFLFFGYSYWLTFKGIQIVKEKSLLLPQAHDEPWLYFGIYKRVFESTIGYLFQTLAEKKFIHKQFGFSNKPYKIVGHGMDLELASKQYKPFPKKLPSQFLLYIGRISSGKGCQELSDFFNHYKSTHDVDLSLIMIGTLEHPLKNTKAKIFENLPDEQKFSILSQSTIFVMPSQYESLNLALLESWIFEKPAIVNAKSMVLRDHCLNSHGGLYYHNYEEFVECLDFLLDNDDKASMMGKNGNNYVTNNYTWKQTRQKYSEFFSDILQHIT